MGDGTARSLGRVTLNPLQHIDTLGTVTFTGQDQDGDTADIRATSDLAGVGGVNVSPAKIVEFVRMAGASAPQPDSVWVR